MATQAMFLFEVVVENIKSLAVMENRGLVIKSDFADIFSLELKDPNQMHIVMPEPLPLPPLPPGKKGKKKPKPKKPKKGKKGKKGAVEEPPPGPLIQCGQSVLFTSSAEILIQNMKKFPMELSIWSKEDHLSFIGVTRISWDPIFISFLEQIADCQEPPPVVIKDEYNIFEEGKAKLMAKITIQVKLSFLNDKLTTSFRTLSEDPTIRKCLYTGINSKTTSYMCTLKTSDKIFAENSMKIENKFIVDKPKPTKINYADYKNASAANLTSFDEKELCCLGHADEPPDSIYKAPETCPDIDFIIDYVRKTIASCNNNMRMLTPRPTISPRVKATDIDKFCYCRETAWPKGPFAERFRKEVQSGPCPICIDAGQKPAGSRAATFDIANIRGPCGKPECRIARDIRAYIENLINEDNVVFNLDDLIGPCGSKNCTLAATIQKFLRHEGVFTHGATQKGLSTQCACIEKMKQSLTKRQSCQSICSKDCENTSSEESVCKGKQCPYKKPEQRVYDVLYFTVEYDFENVDTKSSGGESDAKSSTKYCGPDCPSVKDSNTTCSKNVCSTDFDEVNDATESATCKSPVCPDYKLPPSPADSNIEIRLDEINNSCCVKSCDVAERVKDFISDGAINKKTCLTTEKEHECFCDCVCTFKFSNKTTYCAVCGGYECLGEDMRNEPEYVKPHPCPVYHKMYDKQYIKVQSPWPDDEDEKKKETASSKSSKPASKEKTKAAKGIVDKKGVYEEKKRKSFDKNATSEEKNKKLNKEGGVEEGQVKKTKKATKEEGGGEKVKKRKKNDKFTAKTNAVQALRKKRNLRRKYKYPAVPNDMGWNWVAKDVPGMKFRPNWKPGAAKALLVRKYRAKREGKDGLNKKKRTLLQRKKKVDVKPALIVTKKDGEYTVQMEVFKKYSKERLPFQYPYDEKPPQIYTIGKTAEEKSKIQKQRDRRELRETRRKSRLLQSTFKDRCQEICLKAYNQAIGLLPLPNPNSPDCPCAGMPSLDASSPIVDSCSCSDVGTISTSDTDNDEWVIEFTPPAARWDVKAQHPPVLVDNESQYSYLDYKVKILDKSGNPVPRFFKGPDGKQECSDLGGFFGPTKTWLEINKDGYIGPDKRWVPMNFKGPDGTQYSAEEGFFTNSAGKIIKIGVDGYIDKDGNWAWYSRRRESQRSLKSKADSVSSNRAKKKAQSVKTSIPCKKVEANAASKAKELQKKKAIPASLSFSVPTSKLTKNLGKENKNPVKIKNPIVMSASIKYDRRNLSRVSQVKPYLDQKKLAKYQEIMDELSAYDDIGELKPPPKANRASNTPRSKLSIFTTQGYNMNYEMKVPSFAADRPGFRKSNTSSPHSSLYSSQMVICR